jgi:sodium-dependent phosphate transporter
MLDPYSSHVLWIVIVSIAVGFVLAFGIGANSVPNSFATSVGSKVLTVKQACCIGTVFEIAGSMLLGEWNTCSLQGGYTVKPLCDVSFVEQA